jgi:DNA-binding transcriptional ArsR family regulator
MYDPALADLPEGAPSPLGIAGVETLLSTIRRDIDAELTDAAEIVGERQAALTQALGIQSGLEFVKEAMDRFDAGVYPTDEDAAESAPCSVCGGRGWHTAGGNDPGACGHCAAGESWYSGDSEDDAPALAPLPMTDEDAAEALHWPLDPPATREEILRQLREHPPGFTSLELQARLALSEAVVDGHLRALRKEGMAYLRDSGRWAAGPDRRA